jgi:hypothetical protein
MITCVTPQSSTQFLFPRLHTSQINLRYPRVGYITDFLNILWPYPFRPITQMTCMIQRHVLKQHIHHVSFEFLLATITSIMAVRPARVVLQAVLLFLLLRFASTSCFPIKTTSGKTLSDDIACSWVTRSCARLWFLERCVYLLPSGTPI